MIFRKVSIVKMMRKAYSTVSWNTERCKGGGGRGGGRRFGDELALQCDIIIDRNYHQRDPSVF